MEQNLKISIKWFLFKSNDNSFPQLRAIDKCRFFYFRLSDLNFKGDIPHTFLKARMK
jgi:hypothetical protein